MGQIVGEKEARFDIQKLNWIGSPDRNPTILYMRADTPYKSMDDVIKAKIAPKCGGSGRDGSRLIFALEDLVGAKFDVVLGYQGGSQTDMAVERGEVVCRSVGLGAHFSREPYTLWHSKDLTDIWFRRVTKETTERPIRRRSMSSWIVIKLLKLGANWLPC